MSAQQEADAMAAKTVLPRLLEAEKETIMNAKASLQGMAIYQAHEEVITRLVNAGLVFPAINIGGFIRPPVLTRLGNKVFRHLRAVQ